MIDNASPESHDSGTPSAQAPESYFWPLVALVLVILPQVLVPGRMREGPPLIVPVIEATVFLVLLAVAAKPGPVPRAARPLILSLFAVLVLANSAAAARLVVVVLRTPQKAADCRRARQHAEGQLKRSPGPNLPRPTQHVAEEASLRRGESVERRDFE
jgi:hypothetical protein